MARAPDQEEVDPSTGQGIPASDAPAAEDAGNDLVGVIGPDGRAGSIPRYQLAEALGRGYRLESPEQTDRRLEENREGDRQAQAFVESAASTMTLGGTDVLAGAIAPEEAAKMHSRRELNPEGTIAGAVFGAANPYGIGGAIGEVGKIAGGGVAGALGGGALGRIGGAAAQTATEGGLFGLGEGFSQLGLSPTPLTAEQVVSTLGGNVLFGAATGGVMGGIGGVLAEGARAGRAALARAGEEGAAARAGVEVGPEVGAMDRDAAKAAREAHLAELGATREGELRDTYKAAREYNDVLQSSWLEGGDSRFKRLMQATRKAVRNSLDSENAFVRYKGARTLDALDKQAQAIREYAEADIAARQKAAAALDAEVAVKAARAEAKVGNGTVNMRAPKPEVVAPPPVIEMNPKVRDLLEVNDALRKRIEGLGKPPTSPLLEQLDEHLDRLAHPGKKPATQQLGEQMGGAFGAKLGFAVGGVPGGMIGYHLGSKAAAAVLEGGLAGKLRAGVARSQRTMARTADAFLGGAAKVGKAAPVLSTRVLEAASFAPKGQLSATRPALKSSNPLLNAFKEREGEIRAQTMAGPTGKPVLQPAAAASLHERLSALWAVDPKMADAIETAASLRLTFLAEKLPQRPLYAAAPTGPDRWQPGDLEMRKFARYVAATEDPNGVLKRFAAGRMSPEDAEAFRVCYPEMWSSMKANIMGRLPELQETLPYRKRLMLSLFFDAPVDPSQDPQAATMLQNTFKTEPGSEGGTAQPVPKMGNTKKLAPDPTPAQRMSG